MTSLMTGCSLFKPETIIVTKYTEKEIERVQRPAGVSLHSLHFYVVTGQTYDDFKVRFRADNQTTSSDELVFVAISVKDYENLGLNVSELQRYIEQQQSIIEYYEEATASSDTPQVKE